VHREGRCQCTLLFLDFFSNCSHDDEVRVIACLSLHWEFLGLRTPGIPIAGLAAFHASPLDRRYGHREMADAMHYLETMLHSTFSFRRAGSLVP
jgi:hypothetical protein